MPFPERIQAITISKTGDFDVLEVTEAPFPTVEPGHVLIKVRMLQHLHNRCVIEHRRCVIIGGETWRQHDR